MTTSIGTKAKKFTMFFYIIDRNIFSAGYEKSEIREENTKRLIKKQ